eukprot:8840819-Alexandrium_andersonii.AAC.1
MKVRRAIKYIDSQGSRVALLAIRTSLRVVNLVTAYAPHAAKPQLERQGFYEDLENLMSRNERKGIMVAMGDFNAR